MKAAQNGVPTSASSTAGGTRATKGDNGWAIGGREIDPDEAAQDWPTRRTCTGSSRTRSSRATTSGTRRPAKGWLKMMRRAMASALWRFSTTRMLHEYTERCICRRAGRERRRSPKPRLTDETPLVVTEAG